MNGCSARSFFDFSVYAVGAVDRGGFGNEIRSGFTGQREVLLAEPKLGTLVACSEHDFFLLGKALLRIQTF